MYHLAAAVIGILVYSMLVSPLSPATHSVMGDWQTFEGSPMAAASVAAAWLVGSGKSGPLIPETLALCSRG